MKPAPMMRYGALIGTIALVTLAISAPADASGGSGRTFELKDRCDPKSFNAAIPAGPDQPKTCVNNGQGFITFDRFLDRLNDGGDNHWAIDPSERTINRADAVTVNNLGGEFHTFTEVRRFGQGCVPLLNAAVPNEPPALILGNVEKCPQDPAGVGALLAASGVPAGVKLPRRKLTTGVHHFQCLIHPWMRTTITVEAG
jgi:plastocyanin